MKYQKLLLLSGKLKVKLTAVVKYSCFIGVKLVCGNDILA